MNLTQLYSAYSKQPEWAFVDKGEENIFLMGAEAVLLRVDTLLNEFFNHKSDANKYLEASQQEELEKEFVEWAISLTRKIKQNP